MARKWPKLKARFEPDDSVVIYSPHYRSWYFESRDGTTSHKSEDDAKWAQRAYRIAHSFCIHTGERV